MSWLSRLFAGGDSVRCAWCRREVPRDASFAYGFDRCCSEAHVAELQASLAW